MFKKNLREFKTIIIYLICEHEHYLKNRVFKKKSGFQKLFSNFEKCLYFQNVHKVENFQISKKNRISKKCS